MSDDVSTHSVETLHALARVVALLLHEAAIDDVDDVVDGDRRFRQVRRQHDLGHAGRRSSAAQTFILQGEK